MKDLLLVFTIGAVFVFCYFVIRRFDAFLENNFRQVSTEGNAYKLLVAFDNPTVINSLSPIFKKFLEEYPNYEIKLLYGSSQEIYNQFTDSKLDFGFIENKSFIDENQNCTVISLNCDYFFCESVGLNVEPLNKNAIPITVIWKYGTDRDYINRFADMLLSVTDNNAPD